MPPGLETNFSWLDWGIVCAYLLGTVLVGLYVNRFIRSMEDYVVAGRAVRTWLAVATMTGSELGLVTVMFAAQKGFTGGFSAFHIAVVAGLVPLMVGFTGFIRVKGALWIVIFNFIYAIGFFSCKVHLYEFI